MSATDQEQPLDHQVDGDLSSSSSSDDELKQSSLEQTARKDECPLPPSPTEPKMERARTLDPPPTSTRRDSFERVERLREEMRATRSHTTDQPTKRCKKYFQVYEVLKIGALFDIGRVHAVADKVVVRKGSLKECDTWKRQGLSVKRKRTRLLH